jgi:four helix bundle protein
LRIAECGLRIDEKKLLINIEGGNHEFRRIKAKDKMFTLEIIKLTDSFPRTRTGDLISGQLLRAGTSVGANYRSACRARSRADFISKITIVEEESDESTCWLELIEDALLLPAERIAYLKQEENELTAIFTASGKTAKSNK